MELTNLANTDAYREPFCQWLAQLWPDVRNLALGEFSGAATGYSAQTLIVPVRGTRAGQAFDEKVVLRVENLGPPVYPRQAPGLDVEIDIQYRAMQAVAQVTQLPLAGLIGYEADASVLGAPFFVMEFVEGVTPILEPLYTQEGFFFDASAEDRTRMTHNGLQLLAELHTTDWRSAGLDWLVPPGTTPGTRAQIEVWERFLDEHLQGREHPIATQALAWLHANVPDGLEVGLSWGDARPGNIIWRDFEAVCVTDWENVAIAPPEFDIGWWLMFDRTCHDYVGAARLPGTPTIDEQRDYYCSLTGRDPQVIRYFELFGAVRYAAIITRMMNLYVEQGKLPADQTIWLQNPPVAIAGDLLEELA